MNEPMLLKTPSKKGMSGELQRTHVKEIIMQMSNYRRIL